MYYDCAERFGQKTFIRERGESGWRRYSFKRYASDVDALGTALFARGWNGKHIIVTGENCYAWAVSYMAVICGVGVVVPVNKVDEFIKFTHPGYLVPTVHLIDIIKPPLFSPFPNPSSILCLHISTVEQIITGHCSIK